MIAIDRRSVGGRHIRRRDDVLDADRDAGEKTRPAADIARQILKCLRDRLGGFRPLETGGSVAIGKPAILFETAQKREHAGAEIGA
jgi:hypothetical protein